MAARIYSFACTVPAGTPVAKPVTVAMSMPAVEVVEIDIVVPHGPAGFMGFAIGAAGVPVFPEASGQWIVTDAQNLSWPLEDAIDSGAWEFFGYNTGSYPHTVYVTFQCDLPQEPTTGTAPIAALVGATVTAS